jgi:hypothetical protein
MPVVYPPSTGPWPWWQKCLFRFFVIYILLDLFANYVSRTSWVVEIANRHVFRVQDVLVRPSAYIGSDASYNWAKFWLSLLVALLGALVWSLLSRRRSSYGIAHYWLRILVRCQVAMVAFRYGLIKVYLLQMPFPNLSELSTPLGDFLPMRLSWMFIGYSAPYQIFSGVMELLAGLLLLYRRTVTLGLLMGLGVFANIVALNLCYDIPVKLFSLHLLFYCAFLLAPDFRRLFMFLVLNQPAPANQLFELRLIGRGWLGLRFVLKVAFIGYFLLMPVYYHYTRFKFYFLTTRPKPIPTGIYEVVSFRVNGDTIAPALHDTLRWKDLIFDQVGLGSANTTDTLFSQRYRRGYFTYQPDTVQQMLAFRKFAGDSLPLLTLHYQLPAPDRMRLWGRVRQDSVQIDLVRRPRHFQLTERQFHWLSEYNR